MKIDIHAKNINVSDELNDHITKKIGKLGNYHTHILATSVYLKDEGAITKEVQLKINIKNQTLVCKEQGESFEQAVDFCVDNMKRQLTRSKQK